MNRLTYHNCVLFVLCCILSPFEAFANTSTSSLNSIPSLGQAAIIDTTICEGNCVVFDNISYCEEGTFTLSNNDILILNLLPVVQQTSATICAGETYPGQDWSTSGRYSYQASVGACDITVWVDLEVAEHKETFINEDIKYGDCYDFGPNSLCQTGSYELRYVSAEGCDSTVYIDLIVEELIVDTLPTVRVCAGESYRPVGFDTTLTKSGVYQFYGETSDGRPNLTILNFQVKSPIVTDVERVGCEGTPLVHNGQILDESRVYEFNYTSADGCDSLVRLNLTIGARTTTVLNETIADDAFLLIGNNAVNLEGSYEFVFTSAIGCDSIVQLNLSVEGTPDSVDFIDLELEEDVCSGEVTRFVCIEDLPFQLGENTFYQGGVFQLSYPAPVGCAEEFTFNLTVRNTVFSLRESICEGTSYLLNNVEYTEPGLYTDTLFGVSRNNCDSIIYLNLSVVQPKDTTVSKLICWGEPFIINNRFITESGTYTEIFRSSAGCDSVVTTNLTVEGGPNLEVQQVKLCAGESYSDDIGNKVFVSGLYNFKFLSEAGCDSIVTLNLSIPDTVRSEVDTFFCEGENYALENFAVTQAGTYREVFKNVEGCDSVVQYTLATLDCEISTVQNADTIICGGNTGEFSFMLIKGQAPFSYEWESVDGKWNGQGENLNLQEEITEEGLPSGVYEITVTDINDQKAVLAVEIFRPEIITAEWKVPDLTGANHLACQGDASAFLEINPSGGLPPYLYEWSTGATNTNRIENLAEGIYTVTITDDFNCPYVSTYQITAPPTFSFNAIGENPFCDDLSSGLINISTVEGGIEPYEFQLEGFTRFTDDINFQNLRAGDYKVVVKDINNCQKDTTITIVAPEIIALSLETDMLINLGDSYDLSVVSSSEPQTIVWEEMEGLSCNDCLDVTLSPVRTSTYHLTVISKDDCETNAQVNVRVSKDRYMFIPNSFSPNLDGINDGFTVFGGPSIANVDFLQVFSRWGELLFETNDLAVNNEFNGWDGHYNGQKMPPGVYIWRTKITFIDGESKVYTGDVLLAE